MANNQEYVNKMKKEFYRRGRKYVYNIVHQMNVEHRDTYVETNLTPAVMDGLIAYIQHAAWDITYKCSYSMGEDEVLEVINEFYTGVKHLSKPYKNYHEIDLYDNWESLAGFDLISELEEFKRDGLLEYIEQMSIKNEWHIHEDVKVS